MIMSTEIDSVATDMIQVNSSIDTLKENGDILQANLSTVKDKVDNGKILEV